MLDQGDNAFVYSYTREMIKRGKCDISIKELNKEFSKEDIDKADEFDNSVIR